MSQREAALELARFLSTTVQYRELRQAADIIRQNPTLLKALQDFKALASARQNSPEQMERAGREYQRLMQIPELSRYFQANGKYGEVLEGILNEVGKMLEGSLGLLK